MNLIQHIAIKQGGKSRQDKVMPQTITFFTQQFVYKHG